MGKSAASPGLMSLCVPALQANQAAALSKAPKEGELSRHGEVNWGKIHAGLLLSASLWLDASHQLLSPRFAALLQVILIGHWEH